MSLNYVQCLKSRKKPVVSPICGSPVSDIEKKQKRRICNLATPYRKQSNYNSLLFHVKKTAVKETILPEYFHKRLS